MPSFSFSAILVPTCLVGGWFYAQRILPVTDGVVSVPSLGHPAEVRYDERGVPYIQAKSPHDAYMAQGFVTASERMFQMDILRRTAVGELAEVFGSGSVDHDQLVKKIGFNRLAKDEYKKLPSEMKAYLQAYCQGINDYMDSAGKGRMPLEFILLGAQLRQWQPTDSLAILKYLQYEGEESWQLDDLRQRILAKSGDKFAALMFEQSLKTSGVGATPVPIEEPKKLDVSLADPAGILPKSLPIWGSNAWAVSGALSDSKGALLAYDSHSSFTSPDKYFICSLATPEMHVAGATIPGVPGVVAGRNENIAWGATLLKADTQDLVLEQLSPQFPGKYKTPSGWETMSELNDELSVRFGRPVAVKAVYTKHGPVLLQNADSAVSLQWTGYDVKDSMLKTIFQLGGAKNWQEFNNILATYGGSPRTFMYADKVGNIGYHVAGSIPVRTTAGTTVTPGWTGAADWHGQIKFDDLPHGFNPPQTFAVADNPQFTSTTYDNNPLRAIRIGTVLSTYKQAGHRVGLPEMALLQGDLAASFAPLVKKELQDAASRSHAIDEYQTSALELLRGWDGNLKSDSAAATVYESFSRTLCRRVLEPRLGAKLTQEYLERWPRWTLLTQKILTTKPKEWLPPEERTYDTFLLTTLSQSLKNIRLASKIDDVNKISWQSLHQIRFRPIITAEGDAAKFTDMLFGVSPAGVGGDQDTVNACNVQASVDPWNFNCDSGPTFRMLTDMSDSERFYASLPLGQSEHLFSPYKSDQLRNWLKLEPHSIAFSQNQLDKQQQHKVFLTK